MSVVDEFTAGHTMTMQQTDSSVQSDGNFSQVEVFDDGDDLYKRIEVFRGSQPMDLYGTTAAGSTAAAICGDDHLAPDSNRVFRNVYSEGQGRGNLTALFEVVEEFDPDGKPDGTWEIRARDIDVNSSAFGDAFRIELRPQDGGERAYELRYELRDPNAEPALVTSPIDAPVPEEAPDLADIGSEPDRLGPLSDRLDENPVEFTIDGTTTKAEIDDFLAPLLALRFDDDYQVHLRNLESYMRFGDYGPKSVNPGTNLTGENPDHIGNYVLWRAYRADMALRGRAFRPEMAGATDEITGPVGTGERDAKPGVYSLFVMANELDISLYELVVDKVYSDYGGIPMQQAPGSRLETGAEPEVDAGRAIRSLGDVAEAFYLRSSDGAGGITSPSQAVGTREAGETDD